MNNCPYCKSINSISPIIAPEGDDFILVSKPSISSNNPVPRNGIVVKAYGCTSCGAIVLNSQGIITKKV